MSLRASLAERVRQMMPEQGQGYGVNSAHVPLGAIEAPTISVLLKGYRDAELDDEHLVGEFLVTIASPWLDVEHAENDLDTDVASLLLGIDASVDIKWTSADRSVIDEKYHGWDIKLDVLCKITATTTPEEA